MMERTRAGAALFLSVLLVSGCRRSAGGPNPAAQSLVGMTEPAVRSQLGPPRSEFAGHYGLPPLEFVNSFHGPVKTSVFAVAGGDLYVSFERRPQGWVVICDQRLGTGGAF